MDKAKQLKHYTIMKEFFKNLGRYKVSSTLNILGLGIAFAAVYAILVQVYYDFSFNRSIKDADRIVRIDKRFYSWGEDKWFATMPDPLGLRCGDDELVESFGRMQRKINWNSDGTIVINLEKDNQRHPRQSRIRTRNGRYLEYFGLQDCSRKYIQLRKHGRHTS